MPNTAGCYTAEDAIRTARLGREVGLSDWVKVEVIGDERTLYPDVQATIEATRVLAKEGFTVLPYTNDDVVAAKRLLDAGASAIMPLGAPIGSGMGIQNSANLRILREMISGVPLIVDAGVGTASDAAIAMELGADGVLMNSGIAHAQEPVLMAEAMRHAVIAGRAAYLAGRMPKKLYATASSPLEGAPGFSSRACCDSRKDSQETKAAAKAAFVFLERKSARGGAGRFLLPTHHAYRHHMDGAIVIHVRA